MKPVAHLYNWRKAALHGRAWYQQAATAFCGYRAKTRKRLRRAQVETENEKGNVLKCPKCVAAEKAGKR